MPGPKWRSLTLLSLGELLAMALWFSASAVVPQLDAEWALTAGQRAWLTMSVQLGFVAGALLSSILNLPDRVEPRWLISISAAFGALLNAAIPSIDVGFSGVIALRALTGMALAGVYPPAMKLVASWCREDRGLGIGLLIGALAAGSGLPHLLNALPALGAAGMPPWRGVLVAASGAALVGSIVIAAGVRQGPYLGSSAPFQWRQAFQSFTHRGSRLANFGYFGHMWELYAMWTWVPGLLLISYQRAGWGMAEARIAGFAVIAVGCVGSVVAGVLADRFGRTLITTWSLIASGSCALVAGFLLPWPGALTALCIVWGFAVVADSAQFSAAVSELSDPRYVGTALAIQTSIGFLLTLVTIRWVPVLAEQWGWERALMVLAPGAAFGVWSMLRLRSLPEALRLASGRG